MSTSLTADCANVTCDPHEDHSVSPFDNRLPSTLRIGGGHEQAGFLRTPPSTSSLIHAPPPPRNSLWTHCICLQEVGATPILKGEKIATREVEIAPVPDSWPHMKVAERGGPDGHLRLNPPVSDL